MSSVSPRGGPNCFYVAARSPMCRLRVVLLIFSLSLVVFFVAVFINNHILYDPVFIEEQIHKNYKRCDYKCFPSAKPEFRIPEVRCNLPDNPESTIVLVTSFPHSHTKRTLIRKTWGNPLRTVRGILGIVQIVFVTGISLSKEVNDNLVEEATVHNDIIVGQFVDTFRNSSRKVVFGFNWTVKACQSVSYVVKTTDDAVLNMDNLIGELRFMDTGRRVIGDCSGPSPPKRATSDIRHVTITDYPFEYLPKACSATGYLMHISVAMEIVAVMPVIPYLPSEEIYMALCMNQLLIPRYAVRGFLSKRPLAASAEYLCDCIISAYGFEFFERLSMWNGLSKWKCEIRGRLHCFGLILKYYLPYIFAALAVIIVTFKHVLPHIVRYKLGT